MAEQLVNYILQERQRGFYDNSIKKALLDAGYSEDDVSKALQKAENLMPAKNFFLKKLFTDKRHFYAVASVIIIMVAIFSLVFFNTGENPAGNNLQPGQKETSLNEENQNNNDYRETSSEKLQKESTDSQELNRGIPTPETEDSKEQSEKTNVENKNISKDINKTYKEGVGEENISQEEGRDSTEDNTSYEKDTEEKENTTEETKTNTTKDKATHEKDSENTSVKKENYEETTPDSSTEDKGFFQNVKDFFTGDKDKTQETENLTQAEREERLREKNKRIIQEQMSKCVEGKKDPTLVAIFKEDNTECNSIEGNEEKEYCKNLFYFYKAARNKNEEYCQDISRVTHRKICQMAATENFDCDIEDTVAKNYCFAIKTGNFSHCKIFKGDGSGNYESCAELAIFSNAVLQKNKETCDSLGTQRKNTCNALIEQDYEKYMGGIKKKCREIIE